MDNNKNLDLKNTTHLMGILNITPDSFSDGGQYLNIENALKHAKKMILEGATIIDIGGESSRPGSHFVNEDEEIKRVVPVIKAVKKLIISIQSFQSKVILENNIFISIDTYKAKVAEEAIKAGADIINDISGLKGDIKMGAIAKKYDVPIILMHMRGTPQTMTSNIYLNYENILEEVMNELGESISLAHKNNIPDKNIILDPGIGFAKTYEHNIHILKNIEKFKTLGFPLLVGLSRKRFINTILKEEKIATTNKDVISDNFSSKEDLDLGTSMFSMYLTKKNISILRVHDIHKNKIAISMATKLK